MPDAVQLLGRAEQNGKRVLNFICHGMRVGFDCACVCDPSISAADVRKLQHNWNYKSFEVLIDVASFSRVKKLVLRLRAFHVHDSWSTSIRVSEMMPIKDHKSRAHPLARHTIWNFIQILFLRQLRDFSLENCLLWLFFVFIKDLVLFSWNLSSAI